MEEAQEGKPKTRVEVLCRYRHGEVGDVVGTSEGFLVVRFLDGDVAEYHPDDVKPRSRCE